MASIQFDKNSWIIDGNRVFIKSAAVHYFRLPRAEWDELLDKVEKAGCNCIETYIPWNWHEEAEGVWDFANDKDLEAFLKNCAERNLYVILRPGPYICAEWDFGGLPWWLSIKENMKYRCYNEPFLHYVDRYFDELVPRVLPYLITNSGTVIMVQVENEFQALGKPDKKYMEYLRGGLITRGINVPLVTCYGGVEGAVEFRNFWSHAEEHAKILDERFEGQPKGVLEFWVGWFEQWGGPKANQKTAGMLEKALYELLREGFTAINYYMFFGGTNFDHWGGRTIGEHTFMITSYDYDAPLTEYLQETPKYHAIKRVHSFIDWVEPILTNSVAIEKCYGLPEGLQGKTLQSKAGSITFLTNSKSERVIHKLYNPEGQYQLIITIEADGILPVVKNMKAGKLAGKTVKILALTAYSTGFSKNIGTVYHETGQQSSLVLQVKDVDELTISCPFPQRYKKLANGELQFTLFHGSKPQVISIKDRKGECFEIIVNDRMTVEKISEIIEAKSQVTFSLADWYRAPEKMDDSIGRESVKPQDFSSFGQWSGYLSYTAQFESKETCHKTLILPRIEDPARVFLNNQYIGLVNDLGAASIELPVEKGNNSIRFLVQNMGRYNFTQALGEPKGISESPSLDGLVVDLLDGWKVEGIGKTHSLRKIPEIEGRISFLKEFVNDQGFDKAILIGEGLQRLRLNEGVPVMLMTNETAWNRFDAPYGVADVSHLLNDGFNEFDFDGQGLKGISKIKLYLYKEANQINHWRMHSAALLTEPNEWQRIDHLLSKDKFEPCWYKTTFTTSLQFTDDVKVKIRLDGLSKGTFWVNGFCLGRYWQIGPQEEYKIPASILKQENELIIFDEEGCLPQVKIETL
ncbi:beta-galactosidase [Paenibacillus sp. BSR1-1]|uniref:beta-galactosidase n=1 Tax=Paenibacillus sp. BSR1-1 TaxID=3020845 RepID=UPI0025AF2EEC|nr:beta-galactosidase [Paenibacillus sp. BSR1-1]MDN3018461.1 beta-galactosidase [Paenibacillus sp. BSR1-1]